MEHIEKPILLTVNEIFNSKEVRPNEYSPLALAFIGDSVFDLVIKSVIVEKANCQVNKLQNKTSKIVRAKRLVSLIKLGLENAEITI